MTQAPIAWGVRQDGRLWLAIYPSKSTAKRAAMQVCPPGSKREVFPIYAGPILSAPEMDSLDIAAKKLQGSRDAVLWVAGDILKKLRLRMAQKNEQVDEPQEPKTMHKWLAKAMNNNWTVTTTHFNTERHWGIRFEWSGLNCLLAVQVNSAPAIRITVLGCTLYAGRLLMPPKMVKVDIGELARSKGWASSEQ